ncbi:50S ribosomal protein L19 [Candidatus Peregrinibacteria bacterium]|nr:50S ribosomal protein L19 [Candidatus Peregrinibacteria bacterium]
MHPLIREEQKKQLNKIPEIKAGYTVRVSQRIKEGTKERIQNFEGLVIKVGHGEGVEKTFTVRKIVEGIGVEKIFPIHSPNIKKLVVIKKAKVRRAKLYYMRQRSGKSARLTERHVTDEERANEEAKMDALIQEAVKAEEKRKKEEEANNPVEETVADETTEEVVEEATEEVVEDAAEKAEETETNAETQAESDVETQVESDVEAKVESDVETQAESDVETQAESDVEAKVESDVETQDLASKEEAA